MTYNERLAAAGIETVRSGHNDDRALPGLSMLYCVNSVL